MLYTALLMLGVVIAMEVVLLLGAYLLKTVKLLVPSNQRQKVLVSLADIEKELKTPATIATVDEVVRPSVTKVPVEVKAEVKTSQKKVSKTKLSSLPSLSEKPPNDEKVTIVCSKCHDKYNVYPTRAWYTCSKCGSKINVQKETNG